MLLALLFLTLTTASAQDSLLKDVSEEVASEAMQKLRAEQTFDMGMSGEQAAFLAENLEKFTNRTFQVIRTTGDQIEEVNARSHLHSLLFEGDILLTPSQVDELLSERAGNSTGRWKRGAALADKRRLWDKTQPIPFVIDSSVQTLTREVIARSLDFWQQNTCLRFKKDGAGATKIRFIMDDGCYSNLGRIFERPEQTVSLGSGCELIGTATHEIAHALGIHHTHVRHDRDQYVTVNSANVQAKMYQANFVKMTQQSNDNYNMIYEYGSVMHYDGYAFAVDQNVPTIVARDVNFQDTMGNRRPPTFLDVFMMNTHYGCFAACATSRIQCANGGVPDVNNCAQCKCPSGFAGRQCTERAGRCGKSVMATDQWQVLEGQVGNRVQQLDLIGQDCVWWIENPSNRKVHIQIMQLSGVCAKGCDVGGVEFKVHQNKQMTGLTYCCEQSSGRTMEAVGEHIPVIAYNNFAFTQFQIRFKLV